MSRALQGANVVVDVQQLRTILQALQQTNHLLNQLIQQSDERHQEMKQRMDSIENNMAELRSNSNWEHTTSFARTMNATRTDIIEPVPPKPGLPAYDPEIFPRTVGQMSRLTEAECDELAASWGIRFGPRNVSVSMKREKIGYFIGQPYSD
ncbi:hypothetical protein EWM64_g3972 [Hericium alpestre]|uniref:Uncharacterized protein n=1 Tax=Hericium alpestre TaxID=135208 RepID=A0A4Z0A0T4_9AGAM|nr:hypothetical protein EWM64_g3972 [Hericium alpestre]